MQEDPENDPFLDMLFAEAALLMNKANEAGPDNADPSYVARAFHRLVEAVHKRSHPDEQPDFDLGAVAQTAETYFARTHQQWYVAQTAQLMMNCLQRAIKEEGRKIEFPFLDYDAMPDPSEDQVESYGSGYDPLALHKFAQRIVTRGVLRVRGDDSEIYRAILELNEAQFVETSTREEFAASLQGLPAEIRDRRLAEFDTALSARTEKTPEIIAKLLRDDRARMIQEYTMATYRGFMDFGDHGIRCGIVATLFLATHYANAYNAAAAGQSEDVVEKLRPRLTDLKKEVAAFFADWLTQPLATKAPEGRKAKAERVRTELLPKYEQVVEDWREASRICKDARSSVSEKRRNSWRNDIRRDFPHLPDDLIERLAPMHLWPDEIKQRVGDKGGGSDPEDVAHEHAARLCGADEYAYRLSTLQEYLKQQRRGEKMK
jgi:hypothetical protein